MTYSGLILTFADIVIELAAGSLPLTILFIALASLILGMGVPVTAAYLITAVVAVPALTHLGVNELAAHMIVYWLSQDSNITPPVCIAAFAGATIAKANMWRTAFASFKFAKFLYLGPFLFGYVPAFSLTDADLDRYLELIDRRRLRRAAWRTIPVLLSITRDMEALCPEAVFLNYVNPMAINTWALAERFPRLKQAGLCHSVQNTVAEFAHDLDLPAEEIRFRGVLDLKQAIRQTPSAGNRSIG